MLQKSAPAHKLSAQKLSKSSSNATGKSNNGNRSSSSKRNANKSKGKRRKSTHSSAKDGTSLFNLGKVSGVAKKGSCVRCINRCCPSLLTTTPNKWFDNVILLLIFTSSVMLALDNPLNDPNSTESKVYGYIDYVHTVLFTFEMLIKIIGLGFFSNNLKNPNLPEKE